MGIGDSIGKAAENAMEDLAGTSDPVEDSEVPNPVDPNDDVEVHSSISEGSNAMDAEKEKSPGRNTGGAPAPVVESPLGGDADESTEGGPQDSGVGTGTATKLTGPPAVQATLPARAACRKATLTSCARILPRATRTPPLAQPGAASTAAAHLEALSAVLSASATSSGPCHRYPLMPPRLLAEADDVGQFAPTRRAHCGRIAVGEVKRRIHAHAGASRRAREDDVCRAENGKDGDVGQQGAALKTMACAVDGTPMGRRSRCTGPLLRHLNT